jgi:hypothetical protein
MNGVKNNIKTHIIMAKHIQYIRKQNISQNVIIVTFNNHLHTNDAMMLIYLIYE